MRAINKIVKVVLAKIIQKKKNNDKFQSQA